MRLRDWLDAEVPVGLAHEDAEGTQGADDGLGLLGVVLEQNHHLVGRQFDRRVLGQVIEEPKSTLWYLFERRAQYRVGLRRPDVAARSEMIWSAEGTSARAAVPAP